MASRAARDAPREMATRRRNFRSRALANGAPKKEKRRNRPRFSRWMAAKDGLLLTKAQGVCTISWIFCIALTVHRERGLTMELTPLHFLIVCPLVGIAGFVDSIAGGGGLISLPAYLMTGMLS